MALHHFVHDVGFVVTRRQHLGVSLYLSKANQISFVSRWGRSRQGGGEGSQRGDFRFEISDCRITRLCWGKPKPQGQVGIGDDLHECVWGQGKPGDRGVRPSGFWNHGDGTYGANGTNILRGGIGMANSPSLEQGLRRQLTWGDGIT